MTDENRKHAYLEWLYDEYYHRLMLFCLVKIGREPDRGRNKTPSQSPR